MSSARSLMGPSSGMFSIAFARSEGSQIWMCVRAYGCEGGCWIQDEIVGIECSGSGCWWLFLLEDLFHFRTRVDRNGGRGCI